MILAAMILATTATCNVPFRDPIMRRAETIHYPALASKERVGAVTVIVRLTLAPDGRVEDASILQSSGNSAIDHEAWRAARASDYLPAIRDCTPTEGTFSFRANFDPNSPDPTPEPYPVAQLGAPSRTGPATAACSAPDLPATLMRGVPAEYPATARSLNLGPRAVIMSASVNELSSVTGVRIVKSSGNADIDKAALRSAELSTYDAPRRRCRSVPGLVTLGVTVNPETPPYAPVQIHSAVQTASCAIPYRAALISNGKVPEFPDSARGVHATVEVLVFVRASGQVMNARVEQSSGNAEIDKAALSAALGSTYQPQVESCRPVNAYYRFRANFN